MAGKSKVHIGDKFGTLTVIKDTKRRKKNGACYFLLKCECGNIVERCTDSLFQSISKNCDISCGCKNKEYWSELGKKSNCGNNEELKKKAVESLKQFDDTCIIQLQRKNVNKNSTTGVRGVSYTRKFENHKYRVRLCLRGKEIFLGYADDLETAKEMRRKGEEKYFKPVIEKYKEINNEV